MISSQDIIEYVKQTDYSITGKFRDHLEMVARYMFEQELFYANLNQNLSPAELQCLKMRQKLEAVKLYKRRTGCRLLEAKNKIEDYMVEHYGSKHFEKS